ncbi:hypothetical protein PVK06_017004 [Gossypium arboreum]|uniref:Uncharacterized protein n=1 Tax=Gossypium arboreum TaxID=29729 RepID=A0ABR0Q217_GOSAR|nr:hypothetical protein PVK06_017004 [Gossypium arboreum]
MERGLADLSLDDGEEEALPVPEEIESQSLAYSFCLVGCFFTASARWTFNNHLLIIHMMQKNEDPILVPLVYSDWCLGHEDNFCPVRLSHGMQKMELGCDLSLHAQPKIVITVNNIWLMEEREDNFFGKNWNGQQHEQNSRSNSGSESWAKINPILEFNLEGVTSKIEVVGQQIGQESHSKLGNDLVINKNLTMRLE